MVASLFVNGNICDERNLKKVPRYLSEYTYIFFLECQMYYTSVLDDNREYRILTIVLLITIYIVFK